MFRINPYLKLNTKINPALDLNLEECRLLVRKLNLSKINEFLNEYYVIDL